MSSDSQTLKAFKHFQELTNNVDPFEYYKTNIYYNFVKYLELNGFNFIGSGKCSTVFQYKKEPYVIKFNHIFDELILFS